MQNESESSEAADKAQGMPAAPDASAGGLPSEDAPGGGVPGEGVPAAASPGEGLPAAGVPVAASPGEGLPTAGAGGWNPHEAAGGWNPNRGPGWDPSPAQASTPVAGTPADGHPSGPTIPVPQTGGWSPGSGPSPQQSGAWGASEPPAGAGPESWPQPPVPLWLQSAAGSGQPPFGQPPFGQPPSGGQPPFGQPPFGQPPFGQPPSGQPPFGQPPTGGQPPFGQPPSEGQPPSGGQPNRLRRILLVGLGAILLVAAVSVGVELGKSVDRTKAQPTASQAIPSPSKTSSPGSSSKINVPAVAAKVDPAVVDITSIVPSAGEEFAGTGMILTSDGEVLTNNHVIANGTEITAQIDGKGKKYTVRVLGADPKLDVALVQLVGASGLPTVAVGNSSNVQVGDQVVAIGNALDLKGPPTVTEGIVSALGRSIQASDSGSNAAPENLNGLIQTDAPINPGNSGGPLVDAAGHIIGMNTAAASGSSSQSATNIGFAIPINQALSVAQEIQQGKGSSTVLINTGGFIGVEVITISEAKKGSSGPFGNPTPAVKSGAYVAGVLEGTPAMVSGMQEGDVIVAVNGISISSPTDLGSVLQRDTVGQAVTVTWVAPSGLRHSASVTLIVRPVA